MLVLFWEGCEGVLLNELVCEDPPENMFGVLLGFLNILFAVVVFCPVNMLSLLVTVLFTGGLFELKMLLTGAGWL